MKLWGNAGTVVGDGELHPLSLLLGTDRDLPGVGMIMMFQGVVDQVTEDCLQQHTLSVEDRQGALARDGESSREGQQLSNVVHELRNVYPFSLMTLATGTRVRRQIV